MTAGCWRSRRATEHRAASASGSPPRQRSTDPTPRSPIRWSAISTRRLDRSVVRRGRRRATLAALQGRRQLLRIADSAAGRTAESFGDRPGRAACPPAHSGSTLGGQTRGGAQHGRGRGSLAVALLRQPLGHRGLRRGGGVVRDARGPLRQAAGPGADRRRWARRAGWCRGRVRPRQRRGGGHVPRLAPGRRWLRRRLDPAAARRPHGDDGGGWGLDRAPPIGRTLNWGWPQWSIAPLLWEGTLPYGSVRPRSVTGW